MADLLRARTDGPRRLRALLDVPPDPVLAPGAYDALSARLVEQASFPAVYMTGFGTTASLIGRPDVGLLSMSEMVDAARRIVSVVDVPVIADADDGYGNALNVIRTVREYEAAGVAAVHIEDQTAPKRCGHLAGKQVIPAEAMVDKVRAAVAARDNPEFMLIARTDARAVEGLDAAIDRGKRYRDAGADMLFIEALETEAEIETVAETFADVPLLYNWAEGGRTPPVGIERLTELGYDLVIFPVSTLYAATRGVQELLGRISADRTPINAIDRLPNVAEFTEIVGLPEILDIGKRFENG